MQQAAKRDGELTPAQSIERAWMSRSEAKKARSLATLGKQMEGLAARHRGVMHSAGMAWRPVCIVRPRFAVDVQHLGLRFNEARRFLDDVKSEAH